MIGGATMVVHGNIGTQVVRVIPCAPPWRIRTRSLADGGGQRTARLTADVPMLSLTAIDGSEINA